MGALGPILKISGYTPAPFSFLACKPVGKISLKMPVDDWLCKKFQAMNLRLSTGLPGSANDPGPMGRDQFFRHNTGVSRWYDMHCPESLPSDSSKVSFWSSLVAKNNSQMSRIIRPAVMQKPPSSRTISQETLKRWERAARNDTYVCNQVSGFARCQSQVLGDLDEKLAAIRALPEVPKEVMKALDGLDSLLGFNKRVTASIQRSIKDLTESSFTGLANILLLRREAYLEHAKLGVKPETIAQLRVSPLHLSTLFDDDSVSKAEKEVSEYEARPPPSSPLQEGPGVPSGRQGPVLEE